MTDDPRLSPEQEDDVRRLLAQARHTDPVPDDVADRLDRVLADLATEPAREATVVRLADRRRRAARMLVAAAAVVVAGVGVAQVVGQGSEGESASSDAADSGAEAPAAQSDDDSAGGRGLSNESLDEAPSELSSARLRTRPYQVDADRFSRDVAALQPLSRASAPERSQSYQPSGGDVALDRGPTSQTCEPGDHGRGGYVAVLYDGDPGWVVLRSPQGESQVADLFLCGSDVAVRSVTLPLP